MQGLFTNRWQQTLFIKKLNSYLSCFRNCPYDFIISEIQKLLPSVAHWFETRWQVSIILLNSSFIFRCESKPCFYTVTNFNVTPAMYFISLCNCWPPTRFHVIKSNLKRISLLPMWVYFFIRPLAKVANKNLCFNIKNSFT